MNSQSSIFGLHTSDAESGGDAFDLNTSGISWGAVFAGAACAAALSLLLFILGSGLGLLVVLPWSSNALPPMGK